MDDHKNSDDKRPARSGSPRPSRGGSRSGSNYGARSGKPFDRAGPWRDGGKAGNDRVGGHQDRRHDDRSRGRQDSNRNRQQRDRPDREGDAPFVYPDEPKGVAVRRAAVDILDLVRDGESLDDALSQCRSYYALAAGVGPDVNKMGRADRGFARAMATTVLRRRGTIDYLIAPYISKPLPARSARIMNILRVSAVQSLFLDTPPHAAVSLATALAKERRETGGYAALVNAVARKLANTTPEKLADLPVRLDTPAWLWRGWERTHGPALARKIALAHLSPAPLDITIKDFSERDHWSKELGAPEITLNADTNSLRLSNAPSDITALPGFKNGSWWVQDFSATLPVSLLGDITDKMVVDLCAAPGGKTLQLAAAGARVTAVDRSNTRMERVIENLERTKLAARCVTADALDFTPPEPVDIVLLDAPCTATGTIRRHPDIPWSKSQDDVDSMAGVQSRMIDQALSMLKSGGVLLYCVCSIQGEEGESQIDSALKRHEKLSRKPFTASEKSVFKTSLKGAINRHGDIRVLPSMASEHGGMDGFFISRMIRI